MGTLVEREHTFLSLLFVLRRRRRRRKRRRRRRRDDDFNSDDDDDENGVYLCQSLAKEKEAAHRERKTGSHKHPCKVRIGQFSPRGEDGGSLGRRRRRFVSRETETGAERRNRRGHARGFESAKDDDDGTTDGRRW